VDGRIMNIQDEKWRSDVNPQTRALCYERILGSDRVRSRCDGGNQGRGMAGEHDARCGGGYRAKGDCLR